MTNQHDIVRQFTEWAATANYPKRVKSVSCKWRVNNSSYELDLCMKNSSAVDIKYFVYPKRKRYSMWMRKPHTGTDTDNQHYTALVSDHPYPQGCRRLPSLDILIHFTAHSFYLFD